MDLSQTQIAILERLHTTGHEIVAFPMYANYVGIRKGNCAALLCPKMSGGFAIYGTPAYLVSGNFTVRITQNGREYFVWKKEKLEATAARIAELEAFANELSESLLPKL